MKTPFPVWSDNYRHHYDWCRRQSSEPIEKGYALRQAQIDEYRKDHVKTDLPKESLATPTAVISTPNVTPPAATKPAPPGLVRVRVYLKGVGTRILSDLQCPKGKQPVNWGWEEVGTGGVAWILYASHSMGYGRWRFSAAITKMIEYPMEGVIKNRQRRMQ